MRHLILSAFMTVTVLMPAHVSAQDDASLYTLDMANGRFWQRLSEPCKVAFVAGFHTGATMQGAKDDAPIESLHQTIVVGAKWGETASFLTVFFEDPANVGLPIGYAMRIWSMRIEGKSDGVFGKAVAVMRAQIASVVRHAE